MRPATRFAVGTTHGTWLVVGRGEKVDHVLCLCLRCGAERTLDKACLRLNGAPYSCRGCADRWGHVYAAGTIHGDWLILGPGATYRLKRCRCLRCGTERAIGTQSLRSKAKYVCRVCRLGRGTTGPRSVGKVCNGYEIIGYIDSLRRVCRCQTCGHVQQIYTTSLRRGVGCPQCQARTRRVGKPQEQQVSSVYA